MEQRILVYSEDVHIQFTETVLGCSAAVVRKVDDVEYAVLHLNREGYEECKETVLRMVDQMERKGWLKK